MSIIYADYRLSNQTPNSLMNKYYYLELFCIPDWEVWGKGP